MNHFYILAWFRLWVEMVWPDHLWRTTWTCPTCRCPSTCRYRPKRSPAIWKSWSSLLKHSSKGASNWDSPRWQSTQANYQLGGAFIHCNAKKLLVWFKDRTNTPCRVSQKNLSMCLWCVSAGRCGPRHGETIRERLQPDDDLSLRSPQPQLQEHVQAQTSAGEMAEWCRWVGWGCFWSSRSPPADFSLDVALENSPSDSMSNPTSMPPLIEGYGRKRKKRTSIETNIKLTLEKRFLDVG